jgi:hypothetical protein
MLITNAKLITWEPSGNQVLDDHAMIASKKSENPANSKNVTLKLNGWMRAVNT